MNIRLNPHSEQHLKEQLEHRHFRSPEEVIERALETLSEREQRIAHMNLAEMELEAGNWKLGAGGW